MGLLGNLMDSEKHHYSSAQKDAKKVLALESAYAAKSDEELKKTTEELRAKLEKGASLKSILPDAFAAAREASKRVIGEFPYPVQVLGGVLLHDGDIAEMKTGEGKTLTAVMPIYLNALEGKGAHVVTVNEYLADRDAKWMGDIYRFLGLTVGCNLHSLSANGKREAFACDITYTTNAELGFDYLRDNMVTDKSQRVLRGLHYAVLDEVDSILIDEARTPLIISGPGPVLDNNYLQADRFAKSCILDKDVTVDHEDNAATLTDSGIRKAEKAFKIDNIYAMGNAPLLHYIQNALRANFVMKKDVEYVTGDDEIILVDQFTGRKMEGREFSDGLHQAIQAKEGVGIKQETQTLATITYQNFFRLYDKLSGMTGTAMTEQDEFLNTYNMRVYAIPTNKPVARKDEEDQIFKTRHDKYDAIVNEVAKLHEKGQPVLIGTISVSINEILDAQLKKAGIPHEVLNAKNDADEAGIIARAGQKGAVTLATNMAGRGTDIKLGEGVAELGGLAVLGSERHEAMRIDNQLRGRSGRQGDPGFSRFYVAADDDLFTRYASDEGKNVIDEYLKGKASDRKMRALTDHTQERATGLHYDARRNTLEYDNVLMQQRMVIFKQRDQVLDMDDLKPLIKALIQDNTRAALENADNAPHKLEGNAQWKKYLEYCHLDTEEYSDRKGGALNRVTDAICEEYQEHVQNVDPAVKNNVEKQVFLHTLDREWIAHVDAMEHLKTSIGLRGYASVKPADAYRDEGLLRFNNMMQNISEQTVAALFAIKAPEVDPADKEKIEAKSEDKPESKSDEKTADKSEDKKEDNSKSKSKKKFGDKFKNRFKDKSKDEKEEKTEA